MFCCLTLVSLLTAYCVTVKTGSKSATIWSTLIGAQTADHCQLGQPNTWSFHCSECNLHLMIYTCWTMSLKLFSPHSPRLPLYLASLFISVLFLLVNLTCAVLVRTQNSERKVIVSVRVAINDTLFVLCAVSLSICLYKISKMSLANIYLESKVRYIFSSFQVPSDRQGQYEAKPHSSLRPQRAGGLKLHSLCLAGHPAQYTN